MTKIKTTKNRPYIIENLNILENSKGEQIQKKDFVTLCRCGTSKNKPFCNG